MKKQLATLLLAAAVTLAALPAAAQENDAAVTLQENGSRTAVTLTLPQQAAQKVTSLQLGFAVEGADVQFAFADALPATVQAYRYQDGRLQIYLSGREALLDADGSVALGEICLAEGQTGSAAVSFDPDSLMLVNAAYGTAEAPALQPVSAQLTAADTGAGPDTSKPGDTGGAESGSTGSSGSTSGGSQSGAVQGGGSAVSVGSGASSPAATQAPQHTARPGTSSAPDVSEADSAASTAAPEKAESAPAATQAPATATESEAAQPAAEKGVPVLPLAAAGVLLLAAAIALIVWRRRR